MVGNKVQRVHFGLGQGLVPIGHFLRSLRGLGIGCAIGAQMRACVHQAIAGDIAPLGHGVIVEIMRARDLDRARAEIGVRIFIRDDRDQAAMFLWPDRNFAEHPHDGLVAFVIGMDGHRAIAQHGFGPCRGNRDIIARLTQGDVSVLILLDIFIGGPTRERIFEMPHMACLVDILDLKIGNRSLEMRIPVHQPLAAIDEAFVIHIYKDLDHSIVEIAFFACGRIGCA